jgi:hypothetical protein
MDPPHSTLGAPQYPRGQHLSSSLQEYQEYHRPQQEYPLKTLEYPMSTVGEYTVSTCADIELAGDAKNRYILSRHVSLPAFSCSA